MQLIVDRAIAHQIATLLGVNPEESTIPLWHEQLLELLQSDRKYYLLTIEPVRPVERCQSYPLIRPLLVADGIDLHAYLSTPD